MPWLIDGQTVALHTGVNGSPAQTEVDSLVIGFAGNCEVIKFLEIFAEQANSIAKAKGRGMVMGRQGLDRG